MYFEIKHLMKCGKHSMQFVLRSFEVSYNSIGGGKSAKLSLCNCNPLLVLAMQNEIIFIMPNNTSSATTPIIDHSALCC
jgi:hypothetical protein